MNLTQYIKNKIKEHAFKEKPKECCGFVLDCEGERKVFECHNSSFTSDFFRISPKDYIRAKDVGKIIAVYHSHTNTNDLFSEFDKFNSVCHNITYILYCLSNNSFTYFDPKNNSFNKYIGRKFEIGKTDCYALVRDFYQDELNIKLTNYRRKDGWRNNLEKLFDSKFKKEGFYEVDSLQKYDCILFQLKKNEPSSHIAVFLGKNLILHQPEKSYSRIEEYSSRHQKFTNRIIRHSQWAN
tara:strand:- start:7109 stop:7825 length:717 start_codon:yes stop_codon:yes gene_type:complete